MNKLKRINASSVRLFTELSNAASNFASILVGGTSVRYRALAGLND
jgi:hypothetical protein